jgi:hypothetical protein
VERSHRYSADLKLLAKRVKEDNAVYRTKADALLKQATDFTDLRLAPLQNIKDIFTGKWSGLLSDRAGVGFVFGACVAHS